MDHYIFARLYWLCPCQKRRIPLPTLNYVLNQCSKRLLHVTHRTRILMTRARIIQFFLDELPIGIEIIYVLAWLWWGFLPYRGSLPFL